VEIDVGATTQVGVVRSGDSYLSHSDTRVHFGLADRTRVDRVRIRWPSGRREEFSEIDANRFVRIREGEGMFEIP
jgi:hypothetical protein